MKRATATMVALAMLPLAAIATSVRASARSKR